MADNARSKRGGASERRKQQNRQAQKNYRERQIRRLRTLEGLLESRQVSLGDPVTNGGPMREPGTTFAAPSLETALVSQDSLQTLGQLSSRLASSNSGAPFANAEISASEPTGQYLSQSLLPLGTASSDSTSTSLIPFAPSLSAYSPALNKLLDDDNRIDDDTRSRIISGKTTIEDVLKAGLNALSTKPASQPTSSPFPLQSYQEPVSTEWPALRIDKILVLENNMREHGHSLPNVYVNNIRIKQLCAVTALTRNAEMLGITFGQLIDEDTQSPFYDASINKATGEAASVARFQHVSVDLQPTAAQIKHRHEAWIDVLPIPTLRQRFIECVSMDPPIIDEDDFCKDLANDGLVCWGSTLGDAGRPSGSGAPWDIRSWEAQPWFLKKWWFLVGGSSGELFQASKWWNEMRGDRLRYAWG